MARIEKTAEEFGDAVVADREKDTLTAAITPADIAEIVNVYIGQMTTAGQAVIYTVPAPGFMSCVVAGGYKNLNMTSGQEFTLKGIRPGKRADFIVEFEPMDTRDYTQAELEDKRLEVLGPNIDAFLAEAVGFKGKTWKEAKIKYSRETLTAMAGKKAADEAKRKLEEAERNSADPLWGMF